MSGVVPLRSPEEPARRLWLVTALLLGAVSFFKGFRFPGRWAATQAMLDYSQGFAKRGLFGATFARWLHFEQYAHFAVTSYVLLFVLVGMLVLLASRTGASTRLGAGEPVALFFSSYALTYLAHLVGYLDIPLAILTVALLMIRNSLVRFGLALPLCVVALLIHEMFLLVFVPLILFSFLLDAWQTEGSAQGRLYAMTATLAAVSLATTLRLALLQPLDAGQVRSMRALIERRVDFDVRGDVFDVMTRSFHDNVWKVAWVWGHDLEWKLLVIICAVTFGLTVYLLLRTVLLAARTLKLPRPLVAAAFGAALSPLLMYVVGWDEGRWDTLVALDAYLVLLLLARVLPQALPDFSRRYRYAVVLSVAISMASGEGLMDELRTNTFPFLGDLWSAAQAIQDHGLTAPDQ